MVIPQPLLRCLGRFARAFGRDVASFCGWLQTRRPRPGLRTYHFQLPGGRRRVHLRIQPDGSGLLLVDVTDAIHLNPTAAWIARMALEGVPEEHAARAVRRVFQRPDPQATADARSMYRLVEHIRATGQRCVTCGLDQCQRRAWFSVPVQAPYKADLALTYACNNVCAHCYNPPGRAGRGVLDQRQWRRVLQRLARIGVPHVIFTGGEPTLVAGLDGLIAHAEQLGLVTGLNTNGRRLADRHYTWSLARAGLTHVQITLFSPQAAVHDRMAGAAAFEETVAGIRHALEAGLHTITNTTLTSENVSCAEELVDFLHRLGLRTMALNGIIYSGRGQWCRDGLPEQELAPVLVRLRQRAEQLGMRLLWYTPTPYCRLSPVALELGPRRCNAAEYSVCIEPTGDVLPCQSYYVPAGNILRDPWQRIWNSSLFLSFRRRVIDPQGCGLPQACWECPDLELCGGGCRIARERSGGLGSEWPGSAAIANPP